MAALSRLENSAVALLLGSGCLHLLLALLGTEPWESPLSFRKPALFGISTGLTLWSCLWIFRQLPPSWLTTSLSRLLTGCLLPEVALITLQAWRGKPSHFNRQTDFDGAIETALLVFISLATLIIVWQTASSFRPGQLAALSPAYRLAIRAGLSLLCLSCGLGFLITVIGNQRVAAGLAPDTFPLRGVLKFPHGAALHALQLLPLLAWLGTRVGSRWPSAVVGAAALSQLLGLCFALLQTFRGRSRFELDASAGITLAAALGALLASAGLLIWRGTRSRVPRG